MNKSNEDSTDVFLQATAQDDIGTLLRRFPHCVIEFTERTCASCKAIGSQMDALAQEFSDRDVGFIQVDAGQFPDMAAAMDVSAVPTTIIMRHGQEVIRFDGPVAAKVIRQAVEGELGGEE